MRVFEYPDKIEWKELIERPEVNQQDLSELVDTVFKNVAKNGDKAIRQYTAQFDGVDLLNPLVPEKELEQSREKISKDLLDAMTQASANIQQFHQSQCTEETMIETMPGVQCYRKSQGIENVGLYIPGGTAPLFSTVLMLGIPAKIAGCKNISLFTPPDRNGLINPAILAAAELVGINKVYKIGGVQAIAAMVFGTNTISKVDKIFGPGNQYVTAAKQEALKYGLSIDMPAGPSELLVIADDTANTDFVAADMLSQAEHGADSQVILLTSSKSVVENVRKAIDQQVQVLPRKGIALKALANSKIVLLKKEDIMPWSNAYAPEHLIINTADNDYYVDNVINAGSVFIGQYTPESAGDYASGTNHTLPTNGFARNYSGVSVDSFVKKITFQKITSEGIKAIGKTIELMAEAEDLQAHKNAVTIRLNTVL